MTQYHSPADRGDGDHRRTILTVARSVDFTVTRLLGRLGGRLPALSRAHDRYLIRRRMRRALGYRPDLDSPKTYNEKLGWRMLYDRNPQLQVTTDKISAREYAAGKVGAEILVPLYGVYDLAADIQWDDLPTAFVLKASHGCGMNIIVRDKACVDEAETKRVAQSWLQHDHYERSREWAYSRIKPRLLVEELLLDSQDEVPVDLKFLVFHGKTAMIRVHIGRFGDHRVNFYDTELKLLPIRQEYPVDESYVLPPEVAPMVGIAETLAEDFDYARIDLYLVQGQVRFGEITHYDGGAAQPFRPATVDAQLGALWNVRPRVDPGPHPRRVGRR